MIICHEHKFIFIKSPKAAGTSIQVALEPFCSGDDVVTSIRPYEPPMSGYIPRNEDGWHSHLSALRIERKVSREIWSSYFKFAFERNPWDRTVSNYWFRRWGRGIKAKEMLVRMRDDPVKIFPDWLRHTKMVRNFPMYTNHRQDIIVNFVGMYENLQADFKFACDRIGLIGVQELPFMKAGYREDKRHYSEYYQDDQELIDMVARVYEWEIETFGYEFEEP